MGRPREFDVDEALQAAMQLFWRKGYEGTSLSDLTEGMGITRPSLYGAFGNKEDLFRRALERYEASHLGFFSEALARPTARAVVAALLEGYAEALTADCGPGGCMSVNAALACSEGASEIQRAVVEKRRQAEAQLRDRLARSIAEGDLASQDPGDLARYIMTVAQGMAVQSASGADRAALDRVASIALKGLFA
ncbi:MULTISPECIES: TetR/AcrR family transcriptional regulator [unclassified Aureimonas]|uniref:TetR/AcrR family transcriptional regulator n=1 Tax=unclassified Aureimonas TaxID=2615206 RepID=UPI0006F3A8CB|nr:MULTISPECIES: TetR/AcrR family transcriptional regulator [unclassified Aureimonas]KQT62042.1 TetR family transcriptional regulator [Aureimonas sp. Leaf460]KQT69573.1 TetR family transcriptional regulator [Aureimonas sp. Leaf427]